MWDLSSLDWETRLREGRSLIPDLPLCREEADLGVAFFDSLRLPDVPDTPLLRDAAGSWFREIVAALFGSYDPATKLREFREIFALVGKGASKTTYGAGLMLSAILMNKRPLAEFLLIGPTQSISDRAFSQIVGMIRLDPALRKRFHVRDHLKEVVDRTNKSKLKVKTFSLDILTGARPVGVLVDEIHLLGRNPAATGVMSQIRGGLEKSPEGFLVIITTQSVEQPAGVFKDELTLARAVRDGASKARMLPVLYEFPDDIAVAPPAGQTPKWHDPSLWHLVMPNLGLSAQLPSLIESFDKERGKGLHAIQVWASQHLNIEIGLGLRTDRWRGADFWEAAHQPGLTLQAILAQCEVVTAGIDGGGLDDLLSLSLVGRMREGRGWLHWGKSWAHRKVLELRKSEAARLLGFEADGDLVFVDDLELAYADLAAVAAEVKEVGLLGPVGLDPEGVGALIDALALEDIAGAKAVVGVSQGYRLNGSIKTAEVKIANRSLRHCGQPIMAYAVGNARTEARGNAVLVTKAVSGAGKIDPLMSLYDAVALMSLNPSPGVPIIEQGFVAI